MTWITLVSITKESTIVTAVKPKVEGYRACDYKVREGLLAKASPLDDDVSLLGKPQDKAVVKIKAIEECERLNRQSLLVGSHCDWTMGGIVALMQNNDSKGVLKAIESLTIAFKHSAALQARLLANLTLLRREHYLATASVSSIAKNALLSLPIANEGALFNGKIGKTVADDSETSSRQAMISLVSKLQAKQPESTKKATQNYKSKTSSGSKRANPQSQSRF